MSTKIFDLVTLTLVFDLLNEILTLLYLLIGIGTRALTFFMGFPYDKTFLSVPKV
jgi:hypothetical protein